MTIWQAAEPWWPQGRDERYRVALLTQQEATIQSELDGVSGGVIDWNVDNEIRAAGNLDLKVVKSNKDIDWAKVRLRIDYILKWQGVEKVYPLGVYLPSADKAPRTATGGLLDIEFYDKTIILKQDKLAKSKSFAKNSKITDGVQWIFTSIGETKYAIDPSTKKLTKNLFFAAGTSKLEIMQKLLDALGYFAIFVDGEGVYQCRTYRLPPQRPVVYEFKEGDRSIHSAEWDLDRDGFEVPNRVVTRPLSTTSKRSGLAEDKTSRWGFNARGRWITLLEENVDETTQAKLDAKAKSLLAANQDVHDKVTLKHAFLPVSMNDVVKFNSQGYSGNFAFRSQTVTLQSEVLVESILEGVTL